MGLFRKILYHHEAGTNRRGCEDDQSEAWRAASISLDLQMRQIDRATSIAQTLLLVLTLSTALAAPLLVIGATRSTLNVLFGLALVLYLAVLANAIRYCLHIAYRRMPISEDFENYQHYVYIAKEFKTKDKYLDYLRDVDEKGKWLSDIHTNIWLISVAMDEKREAIHKAMRWTRLSLFGLGLLVMLRLAISVWP